MGVHARGRQEERWQLLGVAADCCRVAVDVHVSYSLLIALTVAPQREVAILSHPQLGGPASNIRASAANCNSVPAV